MSRSRSGRSPRGRAERDIAKRYLARAARAEPRITSAMERIRDAVPGTRLEGLQLRLKGAESFERKLAMDMADELDASARHRRKRHDAVRYTSSPRTRDMRMRPWTR